MLAAMSNALSAGDIGLNMSLHRGMPQSFSVGYDRGLPGPAREVLPSVL
jgi:hypothetical protein